MPATPRDVQPPDPPGFAACRTCPYVTTGPIATCYECASERIRQPSEPNCPICHQRLDAPGAICMNSLCRSPSRRFEGTVVIGVKSGELERTIHELKFRTEWEGRWGWCVIHARIMLGYLYAHPAALANVDAIIPNPGTPATRKGMTSRDYIATTIEEAVKQDDRGLPFVLDPPLIIKTAATQRMRQTSSLAERHVVGVNLYDVLEVSDPARVHGKTIMVYDDVFTTGTTLNAVAKRLKEAGASKVIGLALSRQPRWS